MKKLIVIGLFLTSGLVYAVNFDDPLNTNCPLGSQNCRTTHYENQNGTQQGSQSCWYDSFQQQYKCRQN